MAENRKVQLEIAVEADTSGLTDIADAAQQMAVQVQQSGQIASQGVAAVGTATQELTRQQSALIQQIQRTTIQNTEGKAAWLEQRAAIAGVSAEVAPYLAKLRAMEQGQRGVADASRQTALAMRQVAPQITDIVTQLAGGQAPLQILIQQGGQLKDVFGGIGPAARAVGGYLLALVNPYTLAAAAIAAVTIGASKGGAEMRNFQNAITLSGNALGVSVDQFGQLRDSLTDIAGSKGRAAEVLTEIAGDARLAGLGIESISRAAILMEKATGQSVEKTRDQFARLVEDPAKGAQELNKQFQFLTASVYEQVKALQEDGRQMDAVRLVAGELAKAQESTGKAIVDNAGAIERSWRAVLAVVSTVVEKVKDIGRPVTGSEELAAQQQDLANRLKRGPLRPDDPASVAAFDAGNKQLQDRIALLERLNGVQAQTAKAQAETTATQRAGVAAIDAVTTANDRFAPAQDKLTKALKEYHKELDDIRKSNPESKLLDPKLIARTEQGFRNQFRETGGESDVAAASANRRILAEENARRQQALASLDFSQPLDLTASEKKVIEIEEKLKTSLDSVTRAREQKALQTAKDTVESDKNRVAQDQQIEGVKKALDTVRQQTEANDKLAASYQQQAAEQAAVAATFGKSEIAIKQLLLAQNAKKIADAEATDRTDPAYLASLYNVRDGLLAVIPAMQAVANKQAALNNENLAIANQHGVELLQLELSLTGQTQDVRERIVEQRAIELDYAKKIADIDKLGLTAAETAARKAELETQKTVAMSTAAAKSTLAEWQRTADSIDQSLADAGVSAFHKIRDAASIARNEIKTLFDSLVLQPVLKAVMAPVAGAMTTAGTGIAQSIIGGGGSALGSLGSLGSLGGITSGLGSLLGGSAAAGGAADIAASVAGGADGFAALGAGTAAAGAGTGLLGAASAGLAAIGPVGWVALAALAAYSIFGGKGGGPKTESGAGIGVRTTGDVAGVTSIIQSIQSQYGGIIKGLGGTPGQLDLGIFSAQDPQGTALTQLAFNATLNGQSIENRGARLGGIENVGRSPEELQAAIAGETERVVLSALQASNLTGAIGDYLKQLGDINALSDGAIAESLTRAQTIGTQQAQLQSTLFDLTHTALEKLTKTRQDERAAIDATNQALYDQVAQLQDLATASQTAAGNVDTARTALADAYQRESAALASVVQQHSNYADQLRKVRDSLTLGTDSGLSRAQITARAGQSFSSALSGALAGNATSLDALGGAGTALVDAVKQSAHSPQEIAAAIARVQAGLTTAAASETARATMAQDQLDAMTQQLTALGVINTTLGTVGDALTGYLEAINRNSAAQLALQTAQMQAAGSTTVTGDFQTFTDEAIAAAVAALSAPGAIPGHATGGIASGVAQVGERGREVLDFETPARVYTNEQTEGMFASNAALEPLLRQVVNLLQTARNEERMEAAAVLVPLGAMSARLKKFDIVGMPPVRETTP